MNESITFNFHFWAFRGSPRAKRLMFHRGLFFRGSQMVNPTASPPYLPTGSDDSREISFYGFGYLIAIGVSFTPASHGSPCFETWKQLRH